MRLTQVALESRILIVMVLDSTLIQQSDVSWVYVKLAADAFRRIASIVSLYIYIYIYIYIYRYIDGLVLSLHDIKATKDFLCHAVSLNVGWEYFRDYISMWYHNQWFSIHSDDHLTYCGLIVRRCFISSMCGTARPRSSSFCQTPEDPHLKQLLPHCTAISCGNDLAPNRHQAIISNNIDLLLTVPLRAQVASKFEWSIPVSYDKICPLLGSPFCSDINNLTEHPWHH